MSPKAMGKARPEDSSRPLQLHMAAGVAHMWAPAQSPVL